MTALNNILSFFKQTLTKKNPRITDKQIQIINLAKGLKADDVHQLITREFEMNWYELGKDAAIAIYDEMTARENADFYEMFGEYLEEQ